MVPEESFCDLKTTKGEIFDGQEEKTNDKGARGTDGQEGRCEEKDGENSEEGKAKSRPKEKSRGEEVDCSSESWGSPG